MTARSCCAAFDGVLFGAVGRPDVPDHELIWGLILALRQQLGLALNLRPAQFWPGARSPLARPDGIDLLIVRENTEGEYAGIGGRSQQGRPGEVAIEVAVHSRAVIEKIARFSFERARRRRGALALVTKSNVLRYGYTLWDEVTGQVAADYPDVTCEVVLADAMAARMVERPAGLDVVLCGNLFGDVLSDLACSLTGGLGLAPSANVAYDRSAPGVYEPVHGSAPDIAGRGIANPCACALSAAMLARRPGPAAGRPRHPRRRRGHPGQPRRPHAGRRRHGDHRAGRRGPARPGGRREQRRQHCGRRRDRRWEGMMTDTALHWLPAWQLRDQLAAGQRSPVEVTEAFLARIAAAR